MTERDWEKPARERLEKNVAAVVARIRATADQIEREAKRNIDQAGGERPFGFETYARVAASAIKEVQTLVFNLPLDNMLDAAAEAEQARSEKGRQK